jgi:hypothetical protein
MLRLTIAFLMVSSAALAQDITNITPDGAGGYVVTEPFGDIGSMRNVTPNGSGGYVVTSPFGEAGSMKNISPDGVGGYIITSPFGDDY